MDRSARALLAIGAGAGCISMIYFLSLVCHLPFLLCILLSGAAVIFPVKQILREHSALPAIKQPWLPVAMLAAGIFLITNRSYHLATRWGEWDALGIWNYHARFLTDEQHWRTLFQSTQYDHPDYPLGLPALIAFITRLCGGHGILNISFAVSFMITLLIPVVIFTMLYRKNLWIAAITLILFATDDFYISQGVSQYADTMLAAFFLMALVTVSHAEKDKRMIALSAFFAGCAAWTKNEGIVLAMLLFSFYAATFFSRQHIRYTVTGILLPLITIATFKGIYSPGSDLLHNSTGSLLQQLTDNHRYDLVWKYFHRNGSAYFTWVWIGLSFYALLSLFRRQWPDKPMLLLLSCLAAYMLTYILTPYDPDWHLLTSQNRLMHQLMPSMAYIVALRLCDLPFPLLNKKVL